MSDIVERLRYGDPILCAGKAADEIESLRQQLAGFLHLNDLRQAMIDTANENDQLRQQLAECQAQNAKLSERVVGVGEIAINSVSRDRLAECQAREKVLRDALDIPDVIRQRRWQREALLEAAEYAKQQSVDAKVAFGEYARGCENEAASIAIALSNMAKELE